MVEDPSLYHLSNDMAVLFEEGLSVPLSSVLVPVRKAVVWPKSIAIWNNSTHTLSAMVLKVGCNVALVCMYI